MSEDDPVFDPGLLKKKKKKKKVMVALDDDDVAPAPTDAPADAPAAETAGGDDDGMDFGTKKKKKKKGKKKGFDLDAAEAALEAGADTGDAGGAAAPAAPAATPAAPAAAPGDADVTSAVDYATLDTDFVLPAKKKRKRAKVQEEFSLEEEVEESDTTASTIEDNFAWSGSDRDYQYAELLERVFDIMRAKNPGMVQGERRKFVMKPPQVIRLGSKKSGFINFIEICKLMHRQSDHVLNYLFAELGTTGNLDGSEVLVLKGRFQQRQMESVLRRYIREYVTCQTCRSPDTILSKENRMFMLTCETCGARKSVQNVSAGFQAVVGRRSRIRAALGK